MVGLFEDKVSKDIQSTLSCCSSTTTTTTMEWKKIKKTTKGATPLKELMELREVDWNGVLLATKEEETEREKKLNQRFTVQDKEEEDGGKDIESAKRAP